MIGTGTIINSVSIIAGGLVGQLAGKWLKPEQQESLNKACGVSVLFIAMAGAMEGMLKIDGGKIASGKSMLVVLCLAVGTVIGELLGIERGFEQFGEWLKHKTGSDGDNQFTNGFVTASLTVSIGAMAILGSIQDGIYGDHSTLVAKGILDFIIVLIMASSMGKGCIFSFIPVVALQGSVTALAVVLAGIMTDPVLNNLSLVGNILIFCVGINLVWEKTIKVANLLPALLIAMAMAVL